MQLLTTATATATTATARSTCPGVPESAVRTSIAASAFEVTADFGCVWIATTATIAAASTTIWTDAALRGASTRNVARNATPVHFTPVVQKKLHSDYVKLFRRYAHLQDRHLQRRK